MTEDECRVFARAAQKMAEERSMERIASTFRTAAEDYARRGGCGGFYDDFGLTVGPVVGDYTPPLHAMPLLPDMPTRSRRLLEDLGSTPITDPAVLVYGEQKSMQKKVNFLNVL